MTSFSRNAAHVSVPTKTDSTSAADHESAIVRTASQCPCQVCNARTQYQNDATHEMNVKEKKSRPDKRHRTTHTPKSCTHLFLLYPTPRTGKK